MKYLIDTNICIYIINKRPTDVLKKFHKHSIDDFAVSSITHAELQYGIEKSHNIQKNQKALDQFLLPLTILPFHGKRMVTCYGQLRAGLEKKGQIIGSLDMLIAAQALCLHLTVISNNLKEFSRIPGLKCENWI